LRGKVDEATERFALRADLAAARLFGRLLRRFTR
jgi:hypothetical protein